MGAARPLQCAENCRGAAGGARRGVVNDLGTSTDGTGQDAGPAAAVAAEIEAAGGRVAGVQRETVQVLGTDLFVTPTYRDVPRARGRFPLVLFSPGAGKPGPPTSSSSTASSPPMAS